MAAMLAARHFKWLPNALTVSRVVLAVPILFAPLDGRWALGLWLFLLALLTDFLDGLAAKKLNAQTKLGAELDPLADFSLAFAGVAALALTDHFPVWAALLMLFVAMFVGYERFFWPKNTRLHQVRPMFSVTYLFLSWIFIAWAYATKAYGWSWWFVVATIMVTVVSASLKRHRLRAWFAGIRFTKK